MKTKIRGLIMPVLGWLGIFLLIITIAFEALPLLPTSNALVLFRFMARQRAFEERVVKNALILAYRSNPDEQAEAISELQTTLPYWEKVQNGLQNGDASLGISPNLPSEIKLLLIQAQPDFVYLDTAAHQILGHSTPVDLVQLSIILQHDQAYYVTMAQANDLLQQRIQSAANIYFSIELSIGIALMAIWIVFLLLFRSFRKEKRVRQKEGL